MPTLTLRDIASSIDGEAKGNTDLTISYLSEVQRCNNDQICFIKDESFISKLSEDAGAVILSPEIAKKVKIKNQIIVDDPYLGYAKASKLFFDLFQSYEKTKPEIGENFISGENVSIGHNCEIGKNVKIHDNVSIYPNTKIGDDVEIHSGSVIGSDGFGFAKDKNLDKWIKIYQLGSTIIGNDVEIGANCTIDRGAIGNTHLTNGVKLDNQIHIAHNVIIGKNTAIAAQTITSTLTTGAFIMSDATGSSLAQTITGGAGGDTLRGGGGSDGLSNGTDAYDGITVSTMTLMEVSS